MSWGRPAPQEYDPKPGDEDLPWRTYGQLWNDLRITRGALDLMVQNNKVKFLSGIKLNALLGHDAALRLGSTSAPPYEPNQVYYLVEELLAKDAAARLGGRVKEPEHVDPRARYGQVRLYSDLTRCPRCNAEVQRKDLDPKEGCAVCNSAGDALEAAERLGWQR